MKRVSIYDISQSRLIGCAFLRALAADPEAFTLIDLAPASSLVFGMQSLIVFWFGEGISERRIFYGKADRDG